MSARNALVSGGTRGIGLELSRRLIDLGYTVVALYASDHTAADNARADLGPRLRVLQADLRSPRSARAAVGEMSHKLGGFEVLINNAGINADRPFLELDESDWQSVIDVNLSGAFHLCQEVLPHMLRAGHGHIINVGATTGIRPRTNGANYAASKAGLMQLTKCLAAEFAPAVRANTLIPGMIETEELVERFQLNDPHRRAAVLSEIPAGRIGTVNDVAHALEFLLSDGAAYINGQRLIVDGAQFMW